MTTQSPATNRLWHLEGWGLRWKVTAVVAVPVTVAMVLGGLRVQEELTAASHFSTAAKQTSIVAPMLAMDTALGLYVAGYASHTGSPADADEVTRTLGDMRAAAANPDLDPALMPKVDRVITDTEALRSEIATLGLADLATRASVIQAEAANVVVGVIEPIGDQAILNEGNRLIDTWAAQRRLFEQAMAILALVENPRAPDTALVSSAGSELGLIDVVARYFPDNDPTLTTLRQGVKDRNGMLAAAPPGSPPLFELRDSMIASQQIYTTLIKNSTSSITNRVAEEASATRTAALRDAAVVLATLLATILLGLLVARSLIRPIRGLRNGALKVANEDLPAAIERIKVGDSAAVTDFEPIPVQTTEEIGQLARAVDDIHGQALKLAGEQAHLRLQIGDMFETLARRSKSLVDQQLGLIETLEFEEKDPKRLESLFRLDHLAARMRRNGENLLILSGHRTRQVRSAPVQLGDVVRAAMSEVEDYQRVQVGSAPQGALAGSVATDVVHLLAELLDNSLRASPPDSKVKITFERAVDGGVVLEIADRGIGIPAAGLTEINNRLGSGGEISPETARHMGLFVVSRLAAKHGLTVRLRHTLEAARDQGVTASVHLPGTLLVAPLEGGQTGPVPRLDTVGLPQVSVVHSGQMPQLVIEPAPTAGPPGALPRRTPGATDLPQRAPSTSASTPARPTSIPAPAPPFTPAPPPIDVPDAVGSGKPAVSGSDKPEAPNATRHRYRTGAAKAASFFQARSTSTESAAAPSSTASPHWASRDVTTTGTPIFSGMVSDWLTDPIESDAASQREWTSAADQGWTAAYRAGDIPVQSRTPSGLPQRTPGHRLVPGGLDDDAPVGSRMRDPEAVRDNLSRHQKGIREGRAAGTADHTSIRGDR